MDTSYVPKGAASQLVPGQHPSEEAPKKKRRNKKQYEPKSENAE